MAIQYSPPAQSSKYAETLRMTPAGRAGYWKVGLAASPTIRIQNHASSFSTRSGVTYHANETGGGYRRNSAQAQRLGLPFFVQNSDGAYTFLVLNAYLTSASSTDSAPHMFVFDADGYIVWVKKVSAMSPGMNFLKAAFANNKFFIFLSGTSASAQRAVAHFSLDLAGSTPVESAISSTNLLPASTQSNYGWTACFNYVVNSCFYLAGWAGQGNGNYDQQVFKFDTASGLWAAATAVFSVQTTTAPLLHVSPAGLVGLFLSEAVGQRRRRYNSDGVLTDGPTIDTGVWVPQPNSNFWVTGGNEIETVITPHAIIRMVQEYPTGSLTVLRYSAIDDVHDKYVLWQMGITNVGNFAHYFDGTTVLAGASRELLVSTAGVPSIGTQVVSANWCSNVTTGPQFASGGYMTTIEQAGEDPNCWVTRIQLIGGRGVGAASALSVLFDGPTIMIGGANVVARSFVTRNYAVIAWGRTGTTPVSFHLRIPTWTCKKTGTYRLTAIGGGGVGSGDQTPPGATVIAGYATAAGGLQRTGYRAGAQIVASGSLRGTGGEGYLGHGQGEDAYAAGIYGGGSGYVTVATAAIAAGTVVPYQIGNGALYAGDGAVIIEEL